MPVAEVQTAYSRTTVKRDLVLKCFKTIKKFVYREQIMGTGMS